MTKLAYMTVPALLGALLLGACSDDSDSDESTGNAGSAGASGASGAAGSGGGPGNAGAGGAGGSAGGSMTAASPQMSFFVTSEGSGEDGGNIGGLSGADARCEELAQAAGAGDKTWQAYLSTSGDDGENARDRIGAGPWYNYMGQMIAEDVEQLHDAANIINGDPQLVLDENGTPAPVNEHDIFTGSDADGNATGANCENFTSNSAELTEQPQVGHSDIPGNTMFSPSWNAAHTGANCSAAGIVMRGGAGRLYCFAID
jgi:hypothetical protein